MIKWEDIKVGKILHNKTNGMPYEVKGIDAEPAYAFIVPKLKPGQVFYDGGWHNIESINENFKE